MLFDIPNGDVAPWRELSESHKVSFIALLHDLQ